MATADSVKGKLQGLIDKANETTGNADKELAAAVNSLIGGYGQGGGDTDTADATAQASDIRLGKTAYVNGKKLVGTLVIAATDIVLSETEIRLEPGSPVQLAAYLYPSGTTDEDITWASDDETVASVDSNGLVTYVGYGSCVVTASITSRGLSASCTVKGAAQETDIMSYFKWLGPTTYSPGTYTAWCPTGLIYDKSRDVYAHFMHVQNRHYQTPNAAELWFNTIDPETLEHSKPICLARTAESLTGTFSSKGALGQCIKDGVYYAFGNTEVGFFKSMDGGATWSQEAYETAPDVRPWGCYVLDNGRMIMGSDTLNHKVYYSDDNGKNWTAVQSSYFNEPTFIDFGGGVLMAICRENMDSDNNIQKPWMHVSMDYGASWTDAVAMETVGYMGNNNCNAYVHDNYVELFVGCRYFTGSPQYEGVTYEIRQYVLDLSKGPVDEFEYVNTVYQCLPDDNPQGITGVNNPDDFSTPCIAIKDKSHALLMFYAPSQGNVTHHFIAVGNLPVADFKIPSIIPESYNVSQIFSSASDAVTVCESYGVTAGVFDRPSYAGGYLLFDDIEDGGFVHVQILARGFGGAGGTTWLFSPFVHVKDGKILSASTHVGAGQSPMPGGVVNIGVYGHGSLPQVLATQEALDRYAFISGDYWWIYCAGTWIRVQSCGCDVAEITYANSYDSAAINPYYLSGLTSYKALNCSSPNLSQAIALIEYDKANT